jgi:hypothetical protein
VTAACVTLGRQTRRRWPGAGGGAGLRARQPWERCPTSRQTKQHGLDQHCATPMVGREAVEAATPEVHRNRPPGRALPSLALQACTLTSRLSPSIGIRNASRRSPVHFCLRVEDDSDHRLRGNLRGHSRGTLTSSIRGPRSCRRGRLSRKACLAGTAAAAAAPARRTSLNVGASSRSEPLDEGETSLQRSNLVLPGADNVRGGVSDIRGGVGPLLLCSLASPMH